MNRRMAELFAALALVAASPAAQAATDTQNATAHAACSYHRIAGERKCIAAGQFCQHTSRANRDYHRYGYHCGKADRNGRYHLQYR